MARFETIFPGCGRVGRIEALHPLPVGRFGTSEERQDLS